MIYVYRKIVSERRFPASHSRYLDRLDFVIHDVMREAEVLDILIAEQDTLLYKLEIGEAYGRTVLMPKVYHEILDEVRRL